MKKYIIICLVVILAFFVISRNQKKYGVDVVYSAPTMATSSVGIYSSSLILAGDSGRQYASFCNATNSLPTTNDALFLGFGATSTKPYGILIAPQKCYEMNLSNMFTGPVYAIASTATSTLLIIYK
jgi:hypothetical protein